MVALAIMTIPLSIVMDADAMALIVPSMSMVVDAIMADAVNAVIPVAIMMDVVPTIIADAVNCTNAALSIWNCPGIVDIDEPIVLIDVAIVDMDVAAVLPLVESVCTALPRFRIAYCVNFCGFLCDLANSKCNSS